jgi:hypothetical protein
MPTASLNESQRGCKPKKHTGGEVRADFADVPREDSSDLTPWAVVLLNPNRHH